MLIANLLQKLTVLYLLKKFYLCRIRMAWSTLTSTFVPLAQKGRSWERKIEWITKQLTLHEQLHFHHLQRTLSCVRRTKNWSRSLKTVDVNACIIYKTEMWIVITKEMVPQWLLIGEVRCFWETLILAFYCPLIYNFFQ